MKSKIKQLIEKECVNLLNQAKDLFNITQATVVNDKILIYLKDELDEDAQNEISKKISNFLLLNLDELRKAGKINNLPVFSIITNPKMITIEI